MRPARRRATRSPRPTSPTARPTTSATVHRAPPAGPAVTDDDDATIPTPAHPRISVEKSVEDSNDPGPIASLGETLTYTFEVTNTGNVPLSSVTITDPKLGMSGVACVASLAVGATATCPTKTYVVTCGGRRARVGRQRGHGHGTPPSGPDVSDDDDIPTKAPTPPSIFLDKDVADSNDADSVGSLGEVLTYTFHVTNTGSVHLTDVTISDPMFGLSNAPCVAELAPWRHHGLPAPAGADAHRHRGRRAHGSVDNTATTSGTPPTRSRRVGRRRRDHAGAATGTEDSDLAIEKYVRRRASPLPGTWSPTRCT